MANGRLLERLQIVPVMNPADLNGGATTGDYVSLENYKQCLCVVNAGDGTAGSDLDIALYQAKDNAGTGVKVLNALITGTFFTKEHATSLATVGQWTQETIATATNAWEPDDSGENVLLWVAEISADDLDVDNDFTHIRMDLTQPGAAKIGAALYILSNSRFAEAPTSMPSAIS